MGNLNVKCRASSRAHHSKLALLSRKSWIHLWSSFLRPIFSLPEKAETFWNRHHRRLSWQTWYRVHLRVAHTLVFSPTSLRLLASHLVASSGSFLFRILCEDSILSLHIARSLASARHHPRVLWRRHDVTKNLKHVRWSIDNATCFHLVAHPMFEMLNEVSMNDFGS